MMKKVMHPLPLQILFQAFLFIEKASIIKLQCDATHHSANEGLCEPWILLLTRSLYHMLTN